MSRAWSRLSFSFLMCCSAAQIASGQVTLGTGLRASTIDVLGRDRWEANQVVASAFRFDRPWLSAASEGAILRSDRGLWRSTGSVEGSLLAAGPFGTRLAFVGSLGEPARDSALHPSRTVAGARVSRRVGSSGLWLASDLARRGGRGAPHAADITSGLWRQLRSAIVSVSLSSRSGAVRSSFSRARVVHDSVLVDSLGTPMWRPRQSVWADTGSAVTSRRWPEAEARLYWGGSRWSMDVAVGGRLATPDVTAAIWASADGAVLVSPRVAIVAGVGTAPGGMITRLPAHRHASLGVRLMRAAPLSRALPVELQPAAIGFEVKALAPGQYRVALRVPRARVVELTGDFTRWQPIALDKGTGDWWETTLSITPGTHHVNIRINGERWVAPPGATVVADDFAGVVGVIVVP